MGSKQTRAGAVAGTGAFAVGIANKLGRFGFGQLASPPDGFAAKVDAFLRSFNEYMAVHTENQADGPPTSEPRRYA